MYLRKFIIILIFALCQEQIQGNSHKVYFKNDIDSTSYPSVGNKFQQPVLDGVRWKSLENSILKSHANTLKDVFRHSVDTIKMKSKNVDIIFLIDSSSSVGKVNFYSEINFVKKLMSHFDLTFNYTRIALITFSSQTKVIRHIDQISSPSEDFDQCSAVTNDIPKIEFVGGGTYTYGALKDAQTILSTARTKSRKYIFLVTDGFSNGKNPIPVAEELKAKNVTIFTIGIQSGNYGELFNISSYPKETHSFLLGSFKEFEKLARGALMQDHKLGYNIKLKNSERCNVLCKNDDISVENFNMTSSCCDELASCECRIPSGHYSCACPKGYIGGGLKGDCRPCMMNTYYIHSGLCMPCPDINHITPKIPAMTIKDCVCKPGFKRNADDHCEGITCPKLKPPENGYFVAQPDSCANVLNAACGVRCKSGYQLTGSSLRLCQENGTWSGTEAQCLLKACPSLPVPPNGMVTCQNHDLELTSYDYTPQNDTFMEVYRDDKKRRTEPMPIDTECSYRCMPGNYIVGSRNRNCLPLSKWDGRQTTCKTVLCSPLPKPKYGYYRLSECTKKKQTYGTNCTLICPEGFTLKGPETRICSGKKNGVWTPKNKNSKCVDITPPKLVCPDNFTLELPSESEFILIHSLPLPLEVQDSSSSSVSIWTKPSVDDTTGIRLKVGHHTFTYFASDKFNNKAECNFKVTVLDRIPPNVENCIDPDEFWISKDDNKTSVIEWDEPNFVDNSNEPVEVKILTTLDPRKAVPLVAGEYPILYTAIDRSKNYNECLVNITVKEVTCDPLIAPKHGFSYCAKNASHTWCEVTCDYGYAIYDEESNEYLDDFRIFCDLKHPGWKYKIIPDCTRLDLPEIAGQSFSITLESENTLCSSQDTFISNLSDQMKAHLCSDLEDCDLISEIPECIEEEDNNKNGTIGDREKYHISKREIPEIPSNPKRHKKRVRSSVKIRLYTKISKRLGLWQKNATLSENILTMKHQIERLSTNEPLKRVLEDMQIDVKRLKVEDFVRCPDGSVSKKNICVQCGRGTYQDVAFNRCKLCPLGTFNPDFSQVSCKKCPLHHTTRREGRIDETDCKAHCPPGTWAKIRRSHGRPKTGHRTTHSLMPFCKRCPIGKYQPSFDQTFCLPCPPGFISPRGSSSMVNCTQLQRHICEVQPNICGRHGKCIAETREGLYTCQCLEGFQGGQCEHRIDLCHSAPCFNNGVCQHISENTTLCHCPPDFTGSFCEVARNSCEDALCKNGGTCIEMEDGVPSCECQPGFEGKYCEETINYCGYMPCESGICHNQSNGYMCLCPPGVIGRRCHLRPCDNFPCHPNATCVDLLHFPATRASYECRCPTGLGGHDCSQIINPCDENPCRNNAICNPVALRNLESTDEQIDESVYTKYTCTCPPYFYGDKCEIFTKPDFVMKFPKASTLNYVQMKGPDHDLKELSFCTWIKTDDRFTYGAVLSYATKEYDNAFTFTDYSGFVLYVNGNLSGSDIVANDGDWHFICASWTSENGYYEIYFDGRLEHAGMNLSTGQAIPGKGIFIIGQEQDRLGGDFSDSESFIGQIAYFDVWDSIITGDQVYNFYTTCDPYRGTLYSWTDFKANIHGDIQIEKSNFCQECPKDLNLSNGIVKYNNNEAIYECEAGYILRGLSPSRQCLRTSIWSAKAPYCEMVNCGYLPNVENGEIEYSPGTTLHSVAEYFCNNGYAVDGNDKRVCLAMGVWSGDEPACRSSIQCEKLVLPKNTRVMYANDKGLIPVNLDYYPVGSFAEITCLSTLNEHFLTCLEDGSWEGQVPKCEPLQELTTLLPESTATSILSFSTDSPSSVTNKWDNTETQEEYKSYSTKNNSISSTTETQRSSEVTTRQSESLSTLTSTSLSHFFTTSKSSTNPQYHTFAYPEKDFWPLLYEFLYKGCSGEAFTEVVLCPITTKPIKFINLLTSEQIDLEKYPDADIQLLELLEEHSDDILSQSSGVLFEDFLDIIFYGKDFLTAQRMDSELENALRFTLCIFIDAIAWENKFEQTSAVEDATALENRSGVLKKLLRKLVAPVYKNYRTRLGTGSLQPSSTDSSDLNRIKRSTIQDEEGRTSEEVEENNWSLESDVLKESKGCDVESLPEPPLGGIIMQYLESETVEFGTNIEYGCALNHQTFGRIWNSKCQDNGQWSEIEYECHLDWCDAPPIQRNMIIDSSSDRYQLGQVVYVKCENGYILSNSTNNAIECLSNGIWSKVQTRCSRISCGSPILPENLTIAEGSSFLYEDRISIKCQDERIVEIFCNSESKWTPSVKEIC